MVCDGRSNIRHQDITWANADLWDGHMEQSIKILQIKLIKKNKTLFDNVVCNNLAIFNSGPGGLTSNSKCRAVTLSLLTHWRCQIHGLLFLDCSWIYSKRQKGWYLCSSQHYSSACFSCCVMCIFVALFYSCLERLKNKRKVWTCPPNFEIVYWNALAVALDGRVGIRAKIDLLDSYIKYPLLHFNRLMSAYHLEI